MISVRFRSNQEIHYCFCSVLALITERISQIRLVDQLFCSVASDLLPTHCIDHAAIDSTRWPGSQLRVQVLLGSIRRVFYFITILKIYFHD